MNLVRYIYSSVAPDDLRFDDLHAILECAQRNNVRDGITGYLVYSRPYFLQCLEGKRSVVSRLFERLYRDPRHSRIEIASVREISCREFSEWSMRLMRLDELGAGVLSPLCLKQGIDLPFRPNEVREETLHGWLRELYNRFADSSDANAARTSQPPSGRVSPILTS